MKNILVLILSIGALYLTSCKDSYTPYSAPVYPSTDTVTKGGFLQVSFAGKSFYVKDLTVRNVPVYSLAASTQASDQKDTLWIAMIQMTDHQSKVISMNITAYNNTSGTSIGNYFITGNNSTLTDYSEGQNRVYAITVGSLVNITHTAFTTEGTLSMTLHYNNISYPATGSFKIYN